MESTEQPTFRRRDHAAINALWIGVQFQDAALMAIIVPSLLLTLEPQHHTEILAVLSTLAGIATAAAPPFAGAFSDRHRRGGGDRRLQTAIVLGVDAIALLVMATAGSIAAIAATIVVATASLTAASTIYQVLLPEIVPRELWGTSAGFRGAATLVGTIVGLLLAAILPPHAALVVAAAAVTLSAITLVVVPPSPEISPPESARPHAHVRDRRDLGITLVARAWLVLGMALLNTYVLYFFSDVLGIHNASLGTGFVAGAALLGAIASSVVAGILSDRVDRRLVVAIAGIPMTLAALGFALAPEARYLFIYAGLFGLGYGGVFSVGWALALDAVPELGDVARDLGIWGTLSNIPAIVAPALGAAIIKHGASLSDGYRGLFVAAGLCFFASSITVLFVRKARRVPG